MNSINIHIGTTIDMNKTCPTQYALAWPLFVTDDMLYATKTFIHIFVV